MRIIAIGLGGAGCRIADSLYATDRRSSKVACVQALAIDVDEETMNQLVALPDNARLCYSALDPGIPEPSGQLSPTATIDIGEIVSRVQNFEYGETDAIVLCCGLGGSLVDVAPYIISGLRSTVVEPIFGLVTLPCLAEGERISGKAADDIETLSPLLDGIILFDNETWHKKIRSEKARLQTREKGLAEKIGIRKKEKIRSPSQEIYTRLNEAIVRRISLILRAGEFKADGGIDLAEVVLDSGEVLNTMKGMGFITIGYAVERLPHDPLGFLSRWKPVGLFDDDQKKKASRIVELAKQAIYHEISTPCDMTSAHKALVLVAGPSHELSMKGFMTVRKWIDRSIAGLETRSGDYPVMNTKNVAIIIMLSGLENIPRITELKEIRSQSTPREMEFSEFLPSAATDADQEGEPSHRLATPRDEMIVLPARKTQVPENGHSHSGSPLSQSRMNPQLNDQQGLSAEEKVTVRTPLVEGSLQPEPINTTQPLPEAYQPDQLRISSKEDTYPIKEETQLPSRRRVLVAREQESHAPARSPHLTQARQGQDGNKRPGVEKNVFPEHTQKDLHPDITSRSRETERQRIERELLRQRMVAISGPEAKKPRATIHNPQASDESQQRTFSEENRSNGSARHSPSEYGMDTGGKKTIIRSKRSQIKGHEDLQENDDNKIFEDETTETTIPDSPGNSRSGSDDGMTIGIRNQTFRAKDAVFEGKGVHRSPLPPVRDSMLLHTDLHPKTKNETTQAMVSPESQPLQKNQEKPQRKKKGDS